METYKEPFNTNPEFIGQLRHNGAGNKRKAATSREKQQQLTRPWKTARVNNSGNNERVRKDGIIVEGNHCPDRLHVSRFRDDTYHTRGHLTHAKITAGAVFPRLAHLGLEKRLSKMMLWEGGSGTDLIG